MTHPVLLARVSPQRTAGASRQHGDSALSSTLKSSLGPLTKDRRDTAEGCHDRARDDLLRSVTMVSVNARKMLENSAASWAIRAELLKRFESSISANGDLPVLTATEIAEDAAYLRS